MDDVIFEVKKLRAHLADLERRFGLEPVTDRPPARKPKEQDMAGRSSRLTVIEDGLTAEERTTSTQMNAFIRKAAGRGIGEAPTFADSPRQQAEQAASRRISDSIRAAAGAGTVVRLDAPDPDAPRRDADRANKEFNAAIRRAAGRGTVTSTEPTSDQIRTAAGRTEGVDK